MSDEFNASGFSREDDGIPFTGFDMLSDMPRKAVKKKRKAKKKPTTEFQKMLSALVDDTGLTSKELELLSAQMGRRVPASTLATTLKDSDNPGIKTVEGIALALGKDPLTIIAKALDNPPEETLGGFETSVFATAWNYYRKLSPSRQSHFERYVLRPMIEDMQSDIVDQEA